MAIAFRCTGCGHAFRVHDHLAGKRTKCARCGTSLVVPSESTLEAKNTTWNDETSSGHGTTPVSAAAPAPPRPPKALLGDPMPVGQAHAEQEPHSSPVHEVRPRRRRAMPLVGWLVMLAGFAACVVLAVIVLENDTLRLRGKRSQDVSLSERSATATGETQQPHSPGPDVQDEASTVPGNPAATAGKQNARDRGEAVLESAMTRSDGESQIEAMPGDGGESKPKPAAAHGELRANQPVVVHRTTRFRDESDKESFVHDRTEGRFLKFEEGMARVALEIRIGEEVTGRVPARDLDFGRAVDLDEVDAVRALKAAGAKLASDRIGYIERLECPFKMTDELLEHAAKLPRLVAINANFSGITDAGLAHLKDHKRLKELLLGQTSITDAGLAHLATLPNLEKLDLEETAITDAGLAHLHSLQKLKQLALRKTKVTERGVAELKGNRALKSVKF